MVFELGDYDCFRTGGDGSVYHLSVGDSGCDGARAGDDAQASDSALCGYCAPTGHAHAQAGDDGFASLRNTALDGGLGEAAHSSFENFHPRMTLGGDLGETHSIAGGIIPRTALDGGLDAAHDETGDDAVSCDHVEV